MKKKTKTKKPLKKKLPASLRRTLAPNRDAFKQSKEKAADLASAMDKLKALEAKPSSRALADLAMARAILGLALSNYSRVRFPHVPALPPFDCLTVFEKSLPPQGYFGDIPSSRTSDLGGTHPSTRASGQGEQGPK